MRRHHVITLALLLWGLAAAPLAAQTRGSAGRATGTARSGAAVGTGTLGGALGSSARVRTPSLGSVLSGSGSRTWGELSIGWPRPGTAIGRINARRSRHVSGAALHASLGGRHAGIGIIVGKPYPLVYQTAVIRHSVQWHAAAPIAGARAAAEPTPAIEACAVVTVLQPGQRGYWQRVALPLAGARNRDELQRVLDARIAEGEAFGVRDANGELLEIPADIERLIVLGC